MMSIDCHSCKYHKDKSCRHEECGFDNNINLFPGIDLTFFSLKANSMNCYSNSDDILEIHYCRSGHIHRKFPDGSELDMGHGDVLALSAKWCSDSNITLPNGYFEGLVIKINLAVFEKDPPEILAGTNITSEIFRKKYINNNQLLYVPANDNLESIFRPFFGEKNAQLLALQKIKCLEILLLLGENQMDHQLGAVNITEEQMKMIHDVHDFLLQHLGDHITINVLARKFLTNQTTIKKLFKEVYGTSLAAHIKEHRLERAASMLRETNLSIAEISAEVGYGSQSKFSEAFKEYFNVLPTLYRKQG